MSDDRHRIIHGIAASLGEFPHSGRNEFIRIVRTKRADPIQESAVYSIKGMRDFAKRIFLTTNIMALVCDAIDLSTIGENDGNNPSGK